ncbi:hypothetical protein Cni_G05188 [Canna indica]|uniref:DRBM domain-containing protein n=1 Tax=Canna indica TaxID=4628 RepID=A0AAQ3JUT4_9LILI|nr:hypothetical protein Cni_G05188 [Canna indica]
MARGEAPKSTGRAPLVPMEDAVQALIEHLVQPLLPARVLSEVLPTTEQQESAARQMHAVVILFNYYHRKQFPQLDFLDFKSFCKEAIINKPSLLSYMNFMHKDLTHPQDPDKDLSIMEKHIINACDISSTLDATKNAPDMEGWPVSQIAVFLVDADLNKCYLEFGSITQGSWSLLEKKLDKSITSSVNDKKMKKHASMTRRFSCEYSDGSVEMKDPLQQLAFYVVVQKTGISHSNFSVLEHHVAYSLSQEKSTTMLYIMKSVEAIKGELMAFSIEDVLDSSHGPLFITGLTPQVTPVVEYYHLLPYVNIISDWISRVGHSDASLDVPRHLSYVHHPLESDRVFAIEDHGIDTSDLVATVDTSTENISKSANEFTSKKENYLSYTNNSSGETCKPQANAVSLSAELHLLPTTKDESIHDKSTINENNRTKLSGLSNIVHSKCVNIPSLAISEPCKANELILVKKPRITESNDENFGRKDASQTLQDPVPSFDQALVPVQLTSQDNDEFNFMLSSNKELREASLRILRKRRDDLVQKDRELVEEISQCEMNIRTILNGQGSMKSNIKVMIQTCNTLCSSQMDQEIKVRRLSEAILFCMMQELDDICCENGWMLPRYSIFPSTANGESFQASVTVIGIDFESNVNGDFKSSPREARLSAALNMLSKLRSMVDQAQQTQA